jgi:hypothetical protein
VTHNRRSVSNTEIQTETLPQRWLKGVVEEGRLTQEGKGPAARYRVRHAAAEEQKETEARQTAPGEEKPEEAVVPLSAEREKFPRISATIIRRKKNGGIQPSVS